jgi:hypothetical protein
MMNMIGEADGVADGGVMGVVSCYAVGWGGVELAAYGG